MIDSLKFTFMGSLEARKGRWGGFTDLLYADVGNTKSQTRDFLIGQRQVPADVSGKVTFDAESYAWTLAGEYQAVAEPGIEVDTLLGARMVDAEQNVDFSLGGNVGSIALPDRSGIRKVSVTHWDGIVGLKGRLSFGAIDTLSFSGPAMAVNFRW